MNFFKQITQKPWLESQDSVVAEINSGALAMAMPSARVALRLFLTVAFVVFSLFSVAYYVRMDLEDWRPLSEPNVLWVNTLIILLSSVAFQVARQAVQRGQVTTVNYALTLGGLLTIGFLIGQYTAWGELRSAGYFAASNPANAFFFLLTAVHGLHLIGGLVVWLRTVLKTWRGAEPYQVRLSIELCTTYWHFLALVWLGLLWLLITT